MKICICAIAKNENLYISEWVEYYKKLGIDKIFLYDNNDIDGEHFEDVINDYIINEFVNIINVRGKQKIQKVVYNMHYQNYKQLYDWFLFIDCDEFITLDTFSLKDFLLQEKFKNFNGIRLCWKYYDDNDIIIPNTFTINNYTRYNNTLNENIQSKVIYRGNIQQLKYTKSVHCDTTNNILVCNAQGNISYSNDKFIDNKIPIHKCCWINHYRYKSIYEYITIKMKRGYPNQSYEHAIKYKLTLNTFFKSNIKTKEKEEYALKLINNLNLI